MNEKSEFREFVNEMAGEQVEGVHTSAIARIETFDPETMKADVTLVQSGEEVFEVPVSFISAGEFFIRPPYKKGELVMVVFAESSIDEVITTGEQRKARAKDKHNISDAMVIQGVKPFNAKLPFQHSDDLVIAKRDYSSKIVLKKNGEVVIESNSNIYLGDGASEGVPLGDQLKAWLDSHTHPISWTDPAGNGVSSPPSSSSPSPSDKVRV